MICALSTVSIQVFSKTDIPACCFARTSFSHILPSFCVSDTDVLMKYRLDHYWALLAGFCALYIFLQCFAIPGAIFLSILAGPLFGVWVGVFTVCVVATTGATMCYFLSFYLGRGLVQRCFPVLLAKFRSKIQMHRHNLFFYLLFLRVTPILPNWFISISSPILNVPLKHFFFATLLGLIPGNYILVTTGLTLESLQSVHDATINLKTIITLFGVASFALLPTLVGYSPRVHDAIVVHWSLGHPPSFFQSCLIFVFSLLLLLRLGC